MLEKSDNGQASPSAADAFAGYPWQTGHDVEFYRHDDALVQSVVEFLAAGIRGGQPIVVIATAAHREAIAAGLRAVAIDIDDLVEGRDRVWLDADQTVDSFMVGDRPNPELFEETVGRIFAGLKREREYVVVRAYGEMVDVLWRAGKAAAALDLERLWNALAERHAFWLLCSYAHDSLADTAHEQLHQLCGHHRRAVVKDAEVRRHFPVGLQARLDGSAG